MRIGTFGGVGVYIHWSFWMLLAFYLISTTVEQGLWAGLAAVGFIASVFLCVVLHEFGHVAAAAAFGIPTLDITLLPIGGMARLQRMPEKPIQELWIALAGPAVNLAIAALLLPLVALGASSSPIDELVDQKMGFIPGMLTVNIVLAVFNLLPAFPMDGGRILRSLIAMRTGYLYATEIAARVGRWMALLFAILGIYYLNFGLVLLAVFIFFAGTGELFAARLREAAKHRGQSAAAGNWPGGSWSPSGGTAAWKFEFGDSKTTGDVIDAIDVCELPSERNLGSEQQQTPN